MPTLETSLGLLFRCVMAVAILGQVCLGNIAKASESTVTPTVSDPPSMSTEYWAGKITVYGYRRVPIIGKVQFQTSNHVLATVRRGADGISIDQQVCAVNFDKVFGARVQMDPSAPPRMARAHPKFKKADAGIYLASDWPSGWTTDDLDQDGAPGITIQISAPLCGGDLYMASRATSVARAVDWHGAIAGEISVNVKQMVLGTKGACVSLMARDHIQALPGVIAYEPLPGPTTCTALKDHVWPDYEADAPSLPSDREPLVPGLPPE